MSTNRLKESVGFICKAEWTMVQVEKCLFITICRTCGTNLQSGCTPKCLLKISTDNTTLKK